MFLRVIAHWETSLHGMEVVLSLDLRRGQHHRHTVTNVVEGNLLNAGRDVLETSVNEETSSIDGVCSRVCCQLERLRLHRLSWRLQKNIKTKTMETRMETFMDLVLPATVALD